MSYPPPQNSGQPHYPPPGQPYAQPGQMPPHGRPYGPPYGQPQAALPYTALPEPSSGGAIAALILGIVSLLAWCLPILGLGTSITGLVFGIKNRGGMAKTGLWLSVVGLILSIANAALGAYMAVTGKHPMFPK